MIVQKVQSRLCALRRIEYRIKDESFVHIWNSCTEAEKELLIKMIDNFDASGVENFLDERDLLELGEMSLLQLKNIAKRCGIQYWSRLPKHLLIRRIASYEKGRNAGRNLPVVGNNEACI